MQPFMMICWQDNRMLTRHPICYMAKGYEDGAKMACQYALEMTPHEQEIQVKVFHDGGDFEIPDALHFIRHGK